jgi:hypothetical protein
MLIPAASESHTAAILEIAAMIAALLSYIWGWQGAFAGASGLILVLYVGIGILSHARRGESAWQLGLRVDNLPYALRNAAALVAPAVLVLLAIGITLDSLHFSWSQTAKNAPWLIAWGTAQQYGLLCFYRRWKSSGLPAGYDLRHDLHAMFRAAALCFGFQICRNSRPAALTREMPLNQHQNGNARHPQRSSGSAYSRWVASCRCRVRASAADFRAGFRGTL